MNNEQPAERLKEKQGQSYSYNRVSFWLNGKRLSADIPPAQTTLEFLQQTQALYGTKCSCNEGDCGACTVVVAYPRDGLIFYEAVNSCLYTATRLHGRHLITVEGLGGPEHLHPIQQALLDFHATQCGYCSPGFVMSLFALLASSAQPDEEAILAALEGNLCRCTGYDSILQAARYLARNLTPETIVPDWCRSVEPALHSFNEIIQLVERKDVPLRRCQRYYLPASLEELSAVLEQEPEQLFINGGTDIMVQMNVQRREYPVLIDLSRIKGLDLIALTPQGMSIGANVTYSMLQQSDIVRSGLPWLHQLVRSIASSQIRNFATLAGNIANASPIGDTLPLLLVLGASLVLWSAAGERVLPLSEFFLAYRQTALRQGEIIKQVLAPVPTAGSFIRSIKAAKRKAVDISSVVSAVRVEEQDGIVTHAELALGGVAPLPRLSRKFHNAMANMELEGLHSQEIADYVAAEFEPISDVRGSDKYRRLLIRNHVFQYLRDFLAGREQ